MIHDPVFQNWTPEFLVYGDMGVESDAVPALEKEALSGRYTAIFHVGDFAYNMEDDGGKVSDSLSLLCYIFPSSLKQCLSLKYNYS
jgi:hypothetical protein